MALNRRAQRLAVRREVKAANLDLNTDATDDQAQMMRSVVAFIGDSSANLLTIGGYAGTGKTTVLSTLAKVYRLMFVTPSNKAAEVLRQKKVENVMTLHKFFYHPPTKILECERCGEEGFDLGDRCPACRRGRVVIRLQFDDQRGIGGAGYDAIVLDEASMVDRKTADDMIEAAPKLIAVGDPFQLPPIDGERGFDLDDADVTLTEVVRAEGGVLDLATRIRAGRGGYRWRTWREDGDVVRVSTWQRAWDRFDDGSPVMAQWIAGKHDTCLEVNYQIRRALWGDHTLREDGLPVPGDRVICRTGDDNGQMFFVEDVRVPSERGTQFRMDLRRFEIRTGTVTTDDLGERMHFVYEVSPVIERNVAAWKRGFTEPKPERYAHLPRNCSVFKYGYCITAHSAQGSEWPQVVVVPEEDVATDQAWTDEENDVMRARWRYTAVTRAKSQVILLKNVDHYELEPRESDEEGI